MRAELVAAGSFQRPPGLDGGGGGGGAQVEADSASAMAADVLRGWAASRMFRKLAHARVKGAWRRWEAHVRQAKYNDLVDLHQRAMEQSNAEAMEQVWEERRSMNDEQSAVYESLVDAHDKSLAAANEAAEKQLAELKQQWRPVLSLPSPRFGPERAGTTGCARGR